jgi:leader peptidase (prepilin peptidase) / N-methyltransferase
MGSTGALALFGASLLVLAALARTRSDAVRLQRPAIVILTLAAVVAILVADRRGMPLSVCAIVTMACVVVCAASDLATGLIFDQVTVVAAIAITFVAALNGDTSAALIGAVVCVGPMLTLFAATRGSGIGLGDVKLSGVIGAGLGGIASLGALGAAFVAGALWAMALLVSERAKAADRIAFAPFLAVGAIACTALRW